MATLRTRLDNMKIGATSTDGNLRAELSGRTHVELRFREDSYHDYRDGELARHLTELAHRLTAGCRDGQRMIMERDSGRPVDDGPHWNARIRRLREAKLRLGAGGDSPGGRVRIRTLGLHEWAVRIAPGTVRELDQAQFQSHVSTAIALLWLDYRRNLAGLRRRFRELEGGLAG